MYKKRGFTLIELLVAISIFAIISVISYRTIASLVATKQFVSRAQDKWGSIANAIFLIDVFWMRSMPLVVRDQNGDLLPAVKGNDILQNDYDAQLELTTNGLIGDSVIKVSPPRRVGFRFVKDTLYVVNWPVLNRVLTTKPQVTPILTNIAQFEVKYYYAPDKSWHDTWPIDSSGFGLIPVGMKVYIQLKSGEEITRVW